MQNLKLFEAAPAPGIALSGWAQALAGAWAEALGLAEAKIAQNFSALPWEGRLSAALFEACGEDTEPCAWAPLPGKGGGPARHIRLPVNPQMWGAESARWGAMALASAPELGLGRIEIMAFTALHESAHVLHAEAFDRAGQDRGWMKWYLGAGQVGPCGAALLGSIAEPGKRESLSAAAREGYDQFLMGIQEGFADCWALLALAGWNSALAPRALFMAQLRDSCAQSDGAHRTGYALQRLAARMDSGSGKIGPSEAVDLALGCSAEGAFARLAAPDADDAAFLSALVQESIGSGPGEARKAALEAASEGWWIPRAPKAQRSVCAALVR